MKRTNIYSFTIILFAITCSLFGLSYFYKNQLIRAKKSCIQKISKSVESNKKIKNILLSNYSAESFVKDILDTCNLENENGEKQQYHKIFLSQKNLILLFPEEFCSICIELEIERLKKFKYQSKISLITSIENKRFLKVLKVQYGFNYNMYFWSQGKSIKTKLKNVLPFYYISNESNSYFFSIDKTQTKLIDIYLNYVSNHL